MKKLSAFLLSVLMILCITACTATPPSDDAAVTTTAPVIGTTLSTQQGDATTQPAGTASTTKAQGTTTQKPDTDSDRPVVTTKATTTAVPTVSLPDKFTGKVADYTPHSVTLTMQDGTSYGVAWNSTKQPYLPVVQVCKGTTFNESKCVEYTAQSTFYATSEKLDTPLSHYVSKAVMTNLTAGQTYTYRCYDKFAKAASQTFTFTVKNRAASSFKFLHVSDTQTQSETNSDIKDTGIHYANTLKGVEKNGFVPDFVLHTGDIVHASKYEGYWRDMIETNYKYFAAIPVMPISGNHESTYLSDKHQIYKHFNLKLPDQDTSLGVYYSFDYGNVKFIMLDTNRLTNNNLTADQYNWLENTLKTNKQKWTVISMHNPLYSVGKWGANSDINQTTLALRKQLATLFAQYKVDLVLQGHDHVYSRTYPIGKLGYVQKDVKVETVSGIPYYTDTKGPIYVMHGTAGNEVRDVFAGDKGVYPEYDDPQKSSWAQIEVTSNLITVKVYYYNNGSPKLWTQYGLKK